MTKEAVRAALKANTDGLTVTQIHKLIDKPCCEIKLLCQRMHDVYIDRWVATTRGAAKYTAVWVIVDVPEDAPRPD